MPTANANAVKPEIWKEVVADQVGNLRFGVGQIEQTGKAGTAIFTPAPISISFSVVAVIHRELLT